MLRHRLCIPLIAALLTPCAQAAAETVYDFTYISTRNSSFNNRAHLLNTGVHVSPGDVLHIVGTGQINVGGPYYVMANFDMGLISPTNALELARDYRGVGGNFSAEPIPLFGESVLFKQDRLSLSDDRDLDILVTSQSEGYLYIGIFDNWFGDNTGQHDIQISIVPEPGTALLALAGCCAVFGRRRRTRAHA